jgi:hypothetical protein
LVNPRLFVERNSIAQNIHKSITGLYVIRAPGMSPAVAEVVQIFKTRQKLLPGLGVTLDMAALKQYTVE